MDKMEKLNWDDLRVLSAVIKTDNLTSAARRLQIDPTTASRRITRLSSSIGLPVYTKLSDGWRLNPQLQTFFGLVDEFCHEMERELSQFSTPAYGKSNSRHELAISAPASVVAGVFLPHLSDLTAKHPELGLSLHFGTLIKGLGNNDLIITTSQPSQGRLMVQKLGQLTLEAFAPKTMNPKDRSSWIGGVGLEDPFGVEMFGKTIFGQEPEHRVDTFAHALQLSLSNGAPSILPRITARPKLEFLDRLDPKNPLKMDLLMCFHESRKDDAGLRAVIEWIKWAFSEEAEVCRSAYEGE
ncbi:MAG: LysR family transcriptional regulator [Shimia sp.]|uniref:LysR family transcriptional regulator n=1 Tax=Shimia sp. TaxID=1954381 RepID=UPI004059BD4E